MVKEKDIHLLYYVCIVLNWQIARLKNEKKWKEHFVKIITNATSESHTHN